MKFLRVTPRNRCPICNHDTWCLVFNHAILCMRVESTKAKVLKSGETGWWHPINGKAVAMPIQKEDRPEPVINVGELLDRWRRESQQRVTGLGRGITEALQVNNLALNLGVTVESLRKLGCLYVKDYHAFAFPMKDGYGEYTGIRLRSITGKKWAVPGSHQGIFVPTATANVQQAYVCEGPTDTAAALTLGLYAVGRPSCAGGMRDVQTLFKRIGIYRAVIVADDDDPGERGAEMLAQQLTIPTCIISLPAKDMRAFLNQGGTAKMLDGIIRSKVWKVRKEDRYGI